MTRGGAVAAIVPAAGVSRRFGKPGGKVLAPVGGVPLLIHALRVLQGSPAIRWIVVAVHGEQQERVRGLLRRYGIAKALPPVVGGATRAESVVRALARVPSGARWILIHDAARPCVSPTLLARTLRAGYRHGAAACGLPAGLTVKAVDDHADVRLTLDRDRLWLAQTPQAFRRDWLAQAFEGVSRNGLAHFPDDASVVEAAGLPVRMVPGDPLNLKVTTREDLLLAEAILGRTHASRHRLRRPSL
jgi:2-C-methyl-D-erythritol 4-phosphate cytidylyltransferase